MKILNHDSKRIIQSLSRILTLLMALTTFIGPLQTQAQKEPTPPDATAKPKDKTKASSEQEKQKRISIEAISYTLPTKTGWLEATGEVEIRYKTLKLTADYVKLNRQTGEFEATGNIHVKLDAPDIENKIDWWCNKLQGNIRNGLLISDEFRLVFDGAYIVGHTAKSMANGNIALEYARFATCDDIFANPEHYHIKAKTVLYLADKDAFHTKGNVFKIWKLPVLYLPSIYIDRDWNMNQTGVDFGYTDFWGAFAIYTQKLPLTPDLETGISLEYRTRRGFALGTKLAHTTADSETELRLYGMHDEETPESRNLDGFNRRFESVDDRYRALFNHHSQWTKHLSFHAVLDKMSDIDMLEDWYGEEFNARRQTYSFAKLLFDHHDFNMSLYIRPRLNDFYTTVEHLPEFKMEIPRKELGDTGFYLYSHNTIANLKMNWREFDRETNLPLPEDYDTLRADFLQMLYRPFNFSEWQVTPRAGYRHTYYKDSSRTDVTDDDLRHLFDLDNPDLTSAAGIAATRQTTNYDENGGSLNRSLGEFGLELTRKYYKKWINAATTSDKVSGLRLVSEPYINYTYITDPDEGTENIYYFDQVDRITEQNFIRIGLHERLQSKKRNTPEIYTVAEMQTYADFHLNPDDNEDIAQEAGLSLTVSPVYPLEFRAAVTANLNESDISYSRAGITFGRPDTVRLQLDYFYQDDRPLAEVLSMGSTLNDYTGQRRAVFSPEKTHSFNTKIGFPLGTTNRISIGTQWDLDENEMAESYLQVTRILNCWAGSLRLLADKTEDDETNLGFQFMLYLKEYPDVNLGSIPPPF